MNWHIGCSGFYYKECAEGNKLVNNLVTQAVSKGIPIKQSETINLNIKMTGSITNPSIGINLKEVAGDAIEDLKEQVKDFAQAKLDSAKEKVKDSLQAVKEIAKDKMADLNAFTLESAASMVAGTARSMGLTVEGGPAK